MRSEQELARLKAASQSAVACEATTGVPAELTVAQWAVESGWGVHQPGNNCFGIKAYPGCYGVQNLETTEFVGGMAKTVKQEFATFPTLAACFEKHAILICAGKPYRNAWREYQASKDVSELVKAVAAIYATAPNYATTLLSVIGMPALAAAIAEARCGD